MGWDEEDGDISPYEKPAKREKKVEPKKRRIDLVDSTQMKMPCGSVIFRCEYQKHLAICLEAKGACFPQIPNV